MERSRKIEGKEEVERGYRIVGIEGLAVGFCRTVVTCNFTNRILQIDGKRFYFISCEPFSTNDSNCLRLLKFVSRKSLEFNRNYRSYRTCESCNFQPEHVFIGWVTLWKLNMEKQKPNHRFESIRYVIQSLYFDAIRRLWLQSSWIASTCEYQKNHELLKRSLRLFLHDRNCT